MGGVKLIRSKQLRIAYRDHVEIKTLFGHECGLSNCLTILEY